VLILSINFANGLIFWSVILQLKWKIIIIIGTKSVETVCFFIALSVILKDIYVDSELELPIVFAPIVATESSSYQLSLILKVISHYSLFLARSRSANLCKECKKIKYIHMKMPPGPNKGENLLLQNWAGTNTWIFCRTCFRWMGKEDKYGHNQVGYEWCR
jgi:hypothetical protein